MTTTWDAGARSTDTLADGREVVTYACGDTVTLPPPTPRTWYHVTRADRCPICAGGQMPQLISAAPPAPRYSPPAPLFSPPPPPPPPVEREPVPIRRRRRTRHRPTPTPLRAIPLVPPARAVHRCRCVHPFVARDIDRVVCVACGRPEERESAREPFYDGCGGTCWGGDWTYWTGERRARYPDAAYNPDGPTLTERLAGASVRPRNGYHETEIPQRRSVSRIYDAALDDPMPFGLPPGRRKSTSKRIGIGWDGGWDNAVRICEAAAS